METTVGIGIVLSIPALDTNRMYPKNSLVGLIGSIKQLGAKKAYRNIPHDYITRRGAHNWNYWTNAIQYQLLL